MSGLDRKEILRKDCGHCAGNGYTGREPDEQVCENCGGSGQVEKEVPFKFDGPRSQAEIEQAWREN